MIYKNFIITLIIATIAHSEAGETYNKLIEKIKYEKDSINVLYVNSDDSSKNKIVKETRFYLLSIIKDSLFSYWYGTPWDFCGTTRVPKQGKIACGYFVTAILNDAGFKVPIKWAQLASEDMIFKIFTR